MKAKISKIAFLDIISLFLVVNFISANLFKEYISYFSSILGLFDIFMIILLICRIVKINCINLSFDSKRVNGSNGVFNRNSIATPLNKVNDVIVKKGLFGMLFNYGTVIIATSSSRYIFDYICDPYVFRTELLDAIDEYK